MPAAGIATIVAVALTVAALAFYLIHVILLLSRVHFNLGTIVAGLRAIAHQTAPLDGVMQEINQEMTEGVELLEGLLVDKLGEGAADDLEEMATLAEREFANA